MSLTQTTSPNQKEQAEMPCEDKLDPVIVAKAAGLRYVSDASPGIRRKRAGKNFSYTGLDGKPIHDQEELKRFRSLGIPPAWTNVWICPRPNGHIQATGRDAKGRKQYRYHPRWREVRDETKYSRMIAFGETLPKIRERVAKDLALPGLPHEKVLAAVVWLLDATALRVGNEEYARENGSFGLTTLRSQHVKVSGSKLRFHFRGKSGKEYTVSVENRQLARIVKRCQDLPGHELFQYIDDDGQRYTVESDDVNNYLREITGQDFTAKDFRTWSGTVFAAEALQGLGEFETQTQARKNVGQAIEVAATLRTNVPHIWAAGDATGGLQFTHVAYEQGKLAAHNAFAQEPQPFDDRVIPWVTFSDPALAHIGKTEEQLRQEKVEYRATRMYFNDVERAIAEGATAGLVKLLVDKQGRILGGHILAPRADDLLAPIILAMHAGLSAETVASTIMPYPTMIEGVRWAADQ